ncbi:hypothetical protein C8Q80DRAFT_1074680, partial [Daedaleopsis nitida]
MIRESNLKGFDIPGTVEAVKATLFADNTTVYLHEDDDFEELKNILDAWCLAAGARFNVKKTELLPIGTTAYREIVESTYKTTGQWESYPRGARMAAEGEPVRILGAFLGNNVDQCEVWSPTISKVSATIEHWQWGNATVEGRRHVVQMVLGGMSQFLTDVQRMPDSVCRRLDKILRAYLWNDRTIPPVKKEFVYASVEMGGLKVLDLESRNEAVNVMWLQSYLNFRETRP